MSAPVKPEQFRLGFLTALELPDHGFVGGLLVTNRQGRPLEFQCTAPVKPTRTQEILYGPTLGPFLIGELIGRTLVDKAGVKPTVILTEREEILQLREHVSMPVACVESTPSGDVPSPQTPPGDALEEAARQPAEPAAEAEPGRPAASRERRRGSGVKMGRQWIRFHPAHPEDGDSLVEEARLVPKDADLSEPFERVREALMETVKSGAVR